MLIPRLYNGKNKTFWMFDWEGMKLRQNNYAITAVPTAAIWNGDLSSITDFNGNKYTIYDPTTTSGPNGTRTPFPNNVIPQSRLSPYAKIFQSVTPTPNIGGNLNPWTEQNFQTYYPNLDRSAHVDRQDRSQFFGEGQHLRALHAIAVLSMPCMAAGMAIRRPAARTAVAAGRKMSLSTHRVSAGTTSFLRLSSTNCNFRDFAPPLTTEPWATARIGQISWDYRIRSA